MHRSCLSLSLCSGLNTSNTYISCKWKERKKFKQFCSNQSIFWPFKSQIQQNNYAVRTFYLSIYLSIYIYICLSMYLSIYLESHCWQPSCCFDLLQREQETWKAISWEVMFNAFINTLTQYFFLQWKGLFMFLFKPICSFEKVLNSF